MEPKTRILFVCLGNICRSPAADGIMHDLVEKRGVAHRSRQVGEEDFDRFDMIVGMDDMNYETLYRMAPSPEAARKIFRMTEFCRRHPDRTYVPDPYYEGHEGFELVLDMLEDGCEGILEYLRNPVRN